MDIIPWDTIKDFIVAFGWTKGVLIIFFFLAVWWFTKNYEKRLEERQIEINRLATDNREYRDIFLELMKKTMSLSEDEERKTIKEDDNKQLENKNINIKKKEE